MNSTRILAVFLVAIMGLSVFGMTAVATHDGPNINPLADADEWDGDGTDTVTDFNASGEQNSTVTYETAGEADTADDIEDIVLTIEYENETHLELDMEDAEISNEGTTDEGLHATYDIEHDELDSLPGEINEDVVTDVSIVELDADGDEVEGTEMAFDVTFEFTDERSVMYVSSDALDDDDVGPDATTSTDEVRESFFSFNTDEVTNYEISEQREINGSETDVVIHLADTDMQDRFDERAEDADAGDIIMEMSAVHDSHVALVFNEEANEDIVDTDADTYAVYHGDHVVLHLGDDYEDNIAVTVDLASTPATELSGVSADDVATAFEGTGLGVFDLSGSFGIMDAFTIADGGFFDFDVWSDDDDDEDENSILPLLLVGGAGASGAAKRRATGA